jgi:chromosome segregation ATPase
MDCKKNLADNISAFELLESLRNQKNANRDAYETLSKHELVDKKSKLKSLEEILMMPEISYDELAKLKKDRLNLQNEIEKLENKVKNSASKSSELTIYKQNALQAANNKESAFKILDKLEKEKVLIEHKISEIERKFEQSKGYRYIRKDDIIQQAENVKKKKEIFVKYNKILDMLKGDNLIHDRTVSILRSKTSEGDSIIKDIEEKYGSTIHAAKKELEELSRKKQEIDQSKALTLEEYSKLITQIRTKIGETHEKHAPLIDEHSKIKQEYEGLQPVYNQKKNLYDNGIADIQKTHDKVKEEYVKYETPFKEYQNKYHSLNIQIKLTEDQIKRYESETSYLTKKDKKMNDKYKSFSEYYKKIISEQDNFLSDLKEKHKKVKDTFEDNNRQVFNLFI